MLSNLTAFYFLVILGIARIILFLSRTLHNAP
ncbi:hypothetical protein EZS27_002897 [termite gut metagenome]|uniref:Uncharacterized protein n=1 Tax=termite gut metagenome TaxID=433724 RepID=A0A5J4STY6_9ZZZZ